MLKTVLNAAIVAAIVGIVAGWLGWKCARDPAINFLPNHHGGKWIRFPTVPDARLHRDASMDATFRRIFELREPSNVGRIRLRAARRAELRINGRLVEFPCPPNWKDLAEIDVASFLVSGPNTIEVRVFNDAAPPALWLELNADHFNLATDQDWEGSFAGSAWRHVTLASTPLLPARGSLLGGGETTLQAIAKSWRVWVAFAAVSLLVAVGTSWIFSRKDNDPNGTDLSVPETAAVVGVFVLLWIVLFWNNALKLPFAVGYDSADHGAYIKYVQDHRALPLPNQGYEMFQPPLYYIVSAAALSVCHLSVSDIHGVILLRGLTMLFGIANFTLVFLSLRLLFPRRIAVQFIGLAIAAFLPMQVYLSHYVTNETLAAALATGTLYLCLRALKTERPSIGLYASLGICAGAALLAKATSLLLFPAAGAALIIHLGQRRQAWLQTLGISALTCVAVCGWHYFRIWRTFGNPIVGNWQAISGFSWWQDPGFHTAADYFRFGQTFIAPLFSGFNGFADGIYSTVWGDGLCGGLSDLFSRTPWNYNLVVSGYLFAITPAFLIVLGAAVAVYRFLRVPSPELILLLGFAATIVFAIIFMTLRVPSYAQIKGFYGLSALVPLTWLAALGFQTLSRCGTFLKFALIALLSFWTLNSYASLWIVKSGSQLIYSAFRSISQNQPDRALSYAQQAVRVDPENAIARFCLAQVLTNRGANDQALDEAARGIALDSSNADCHLLSAILLDKQEEKGKAMVEARLAVEQSPQNPRTHEILLTCALHSRLSDEAIAAGREALAISPFNPETHYRIGLAAAQMADFETAVDQFAYALILDPSAAEVRDKLRLAFTLAKSRPNSQQTLLTMAGSAPDCPVLLNELAWVFATDNNPRMRNASLALYLAERSCDLTQRQQPDALIALAAACAEAGRVSDAADVARAAWSISEKLGDTFNLQRSENLISSFQNNRAYRE